MADTANQVLDALHADLDALKNAIDADDHDGEDITHGNNIQRMFYTLFAEFGDMDESRGLDADIDKEAYGGKAILSMPIQSKTL